MGEPFISQTPHVSLIMFETNLHISINIIRDLEEVKIAAKFFFWLGKPVPLKWFMSFTMLFANYFMHISIF